MMGLTPNEESMLREIKINEEEILRLTRSVSNQYAAFREVVGTKADCSLCGNRHWPVCKGD